MTNTTVHSAGNRLPASTKVIEISVCKLIITDIFGFFAYDIIAYQFAIADSVFWKVESSSGKLAPRTGSGSGKCGTGRVEQMQAGSRERTWSGENAKCRKWEERG